MNYSYFNATVNVPHSGPRDDCRLCGRKHKRQINLALREFQSGRDDLVGISTRRDDMVMATTARTRSAAGDPNQSN